MAVSHRREVDALPPFAPAHCRVCLETLPTSAAFCPRCGTRREHPTTGPKMAPTHIKGIWPPPPEDDRTPTPQRPPVQSQEGGHPLPPSPIRPGGPTTGSGELPTIASLQRWQRGQGVSRHLAPLDARESTLPAPPRHPYGLTTGALQAMREAGDSFWTRGRSGVLSEGALPVQTPESALPDWLQPATSRQTPVKDITWLTGRRSEPLEGKAASLSEDSGPTTVIKRQERAPGQIVAGPLPQAAEEGVFCTGCHGVGWRFDPQGQQRETCAECRGTGRSARPPEPESAIVATSAETPQTTEEIPGMVEETEGGRRNLEDMLEEVTEALSGVHIQSGSCASRLTMARERLAEMVKRLASDNQEEQAILGLTESAAQKALAFLRKAEEDARAAEQKLRYVEMSLEVGVLHAEAWQGTFGRGRREEAEEDSDGSRH